MHLPLTTFVRSLTGLLLLASLPLARAGQVSIHDPVIARENGTYYLFSTGPGITVYSSQDLKSWRLRGRVFPGDPAWARQVAPKYNGHLWAPDIVHHAGRFYLYYSVSSFGSNASAIGVTVNRTLDPDSPDYRWEDQGIVLRSVPSRDLWNAIDPAVVVADDGTPWMSFGSFWGGLKLVKLAPSLTAVAEPQVWHSIAKRDRSVLTPDTDPGPAELEAPFIFRKGDYYYLFASWDKCCRGRQSTYKMVVGRSRSIAGPYLDRDGVDLAVGGGTLLLAGNADWAGVGHNGVYTFDGRDWIVFHAYENADNGLQKLKIAGLTWDDQQWPVVDPRALRDYVSELLPWNEDSSPMTNAPTAPIRLTVLEKVGFGAGDMAVNVVWSSMALIITFFYTDVFGLRPADLAALFLVVRFIDAITDPLMGLITDKYTTRWGRYRPYFLFLAVPFGISIFLTFTTPELGYGGKLLWAYATYILLTLIFTAVTIPYISLIGVLTDSTSERLSANGYRLFFAKVAAFLVTIIVPVLAAKWGAGDLPRGYQSAMGVMAVAAAVLFLFCFFTTTERLQHVVETKPVLAQAKLLFRNDQWVVLCAVCVIGTIGYVIRGAVAAYYAKYYLGGDAVLLSRFLATGVVAAILAMVVSTWITKRYCKVALFRWSQIATAVVSVAMFLAVGRHDVGLAFVLYFVLSLVVDLQAPVFWSAIAEAIDYGEHKLGERVSGLAWGGISFCQKAGMGLGGAIVGWLLTYYDYVPDRPQGDVTLTGIALMLTIIPGFFHLVMGLLMFRYRITDSYYHTMMRSPPAAPVRT